MLRSPRDTMIEATKNKKARTTRCRDPVEEAEAADLEADRAAADSAEAEEALAVDRTVDSAGLTEADFTVDLIGEDFTEVPSLAAASLGRADIITAVAVALAACWAF